MSDAEDEPFDKEAEREKLRQQLAAEEEDRQQTQRMSDLLLKGATMTNRHCDQCGDPLFRHEGREFCPTCGRERVGRGEAADEEATAAGDGGTQAAPPGETGSAGPQPEPTASTQAGSTGEADLPEARAALARKVTALAREAEATADVGRARELLAAVREGAEALRALQGQP